MAVILTTKVNGMTAAVDLVATECPRCGCIYAVGANFIQERRRTGITFYCPEGHTASFRETETDRLRKQLAQTTSSLDQVKASRDYERGRRERTERRLSAAKGQVTKIKNRVKNGVCPCCNRTFQDLQRHMQSQHPEFGNITEAEA